MDQTEKPRRQKQEAEPATDDIVEVANDVLRLQLPISAPGLGHVNCYALIDGDGAALIDPGLPGSDNVDVVKDRLRAANIPLDRVHTLITTHSHFDHFGALTELAEESGAKVVAHRSFHTAMDVECNDPTHDHGDEPNYERYRRDDGLTPWGTKGPWDPEHVSTLGQDLVTALRTFAPHPTHRLAHNQTISLARREWTAVHTPGHTHDHICLYDPVEKVLLSGDHVLPTITPHIGGTLTRDHLDDFYTSLEQVAALDVDLGLPAHGHPFTNVGERTKAIHEHHLERLDEILSVLSRGWVTVVDASHELFREQSWGFLAESETFAHIEHLRLQGKVSRRDTDAGVPEFTASAR